MTTTATRQRPHLTPTADPLYAAFLTQLITQRQPVRGAGRPQSGNDPAAFHRAFLAALQAAVAAVSARVQTCPHCGWLFLKQRKQRYCSPRCSQQVRMARFNRNNPRDYQRERAQAHRRKVSA